MKKYLSIFAAAALMLAGCKEPEPVAVPQVLELVSEATVNVGPDGGSANVVFKSNKDWTVSSEAAWISVNPAEGKGAEDNQEVKLSIAENDGSGRNAVVKVVSGEKSLEVKVSQDIKPEVELVSDAECTLSKIDSVLVVSFKSNVEWTASSDAEWLVVAPAKGNAAAAEQSISCTIDKAKVANAQVATVSIVAGPKAKAEVKVAYAGPQGKGISTVADLEEFADSVNVNGSINKWVNAEGVVYLNNDLDFAGANHTPIGRSDANSFRGVFDGQNHSIKNLKYVNTELEFHGVFGFIGDKTEAGRGVVKNLIVDASCSFVGSATEKTAGSLVRLAAVCGFVNHYSEIRGCKNYASVTMETSNIANARRLGGITASCKGNVYDCYNYGKISSDTNEAEAITSTGQFNIGGVIGCLCDGTTVKEQFVENCFNYGDVEVNVSKYLSRTGNDYNNIGGVIGYAYGAQSSAVYTNYVHIKNIENHGNVTVTGGSLVTFKNYQRYGGCIGYLAYGEAENLLNTGTVKAYDFPKSGGGGIRMAGCVGYISDVDGSDKGSFLKNAVNKGKVILAADVKAAGAVCQCGGVAGCVEKHVFLTNLTNEAEGEMINEGTPNFQRIAGVLGCHYASTVCENLVNKGTVALAADAPLGGGIGGVISYAGTASALTLKGATFSGTIKVAKKQTHSFNPAGAANLDYNVGVFVARSQAGEQYSDLVVSNGAKVVYYEGETEKTVNITRENYQTLLTGETGFKTFGETIKAIGGVNYNVADFVTFK